jgi:PPOX class probable F420-dependent enzyme/deazaflavin-dependent oxidoreductase (nitroreductase family)
MTHINENVDAAHRSEEQTSTSGDAHRTRLWNARHVVTKYLNPFMRHFAARVPGFGIVTHIGRRSGKQHRTPVNVFERADHVVFMLTYGSDTDWVKNVRAAGRCELSTAGREIALVEPELIVDRSRSLAPKPVRVIGELIGVIEFLRMQKVPFSTERALQDLAVRKNMRLETRKRDGRWVPTAVNPVVDDGQVLFRTWSTSGKAKRLRNDSAVRFAASDARGEPRGPTLQGRATLLDGPEASRAATLIERKFPILQGIGVPVFHRLRGYTTQHYAIRDITAGQ